MNLNATLIVQSITFLVFVLLMWRAAWPKIIAAMQERQKRIADGLAAADRSAAALADATAKGEQSLAAARTQAQDILGAANKQAQQLVEQAKNTAQQEAARIVAKAQEDVAREVGHAREELRKQVGELAVIGASKILKREIDAKAHADVLSDLAARI